MAILFTNLIAYSQTTILNDKGDTLIGFTIPEAKFLLLKVHEVEELKTLNYALKEQKGDCEFINIEQRGQLRNYEQVVKNQNEKMAMINLQFAGLESDLKKSNKRYKRQVVYKWVAISITAFTAYLWVTK